MTEILKQAVRLTRDGEVRRQQNAEKAAERLYQDVLSSIRAVAASGYSVLSLPRKFVDSDARRLVIDRLLADGFKVDVERNFISWSHAMENTDE